LNLFFNSHAIVKNLEFFFIIGHFPQANILKKKVNSLSKYIYAKNCHLKIPTSVCPFRQLVLSDCTIISSFIGKKKKNQFPGIN
jgi:hypothetical protein